MPEASSKRQSEDLSPAPFKRSKDTIFSEEVWQLLSNQWKSPLPDTSLMFPWLHGDTQDTLPKQYLDDPYSSNYDRFAVSVIRSNIRDNKYIENSGLLKSSLEVFDILLPATKETAIEVVVRDLLKPFDAVPEADVVQLIEDCLLFETMPLLKTDTAHSVYNSENNSVRNNYQKWKQPRTFRRFDLQSSLQFHLSKHCIVYCVSQSCCCERLINVLKWARRLTNLPECQFRVLRGEIQNKLWGTPPILLSSLQNKKGLCSDFDLATFKNWDRDMYYTERLEVSKMSSASKVENLWCGNSTDAEIWKIGKFLAKEAPETSTEYYEPLNSIVNATELNDDVLFNIPSKTNDWTLFVNCFENAQLPPLDKIVDLIKNPVDNPVWLTFPSSGSIGLGNLNLDSIQTILNLCHLLEFYPRNKLIFSPDGYTETSFLLVAYLIFKLDKTLDDVIFDLHKKYNRPFFLFLVDIQVLAHLETLLRQYSPARNPGADPKVSLTIDSDTFSKIFFIKPPTDSPFLKCKGPLPSRILPHLYLGSLKHAQCPEMLKELGIKNIVSVGESVSWCRPRASTLNDGPMLPCREMERKRSNSLQILPTENPNATSVVNITEQDGFRVCHIDNLGDNGMDPMLHQLDLVLDFIDECYQKDEKVFVHCMVGVSRSATVCIAECMKRLKCGLLKAYLYVRVRRLNIIIQPSLMFIYELLKWQELHESHDPDVTWDWNMICRCISQLNSNYI
ncbi:unnamed protein product [Kluyveromyces dobzhanskii CBS 2104]|uniref:WGS project CCBQ000000000 data, contig 00272 n=1 Tax=Kluyveromyces dobzhanskii CBS 2104 TaxID=1427455 RepID=A0A0A8LB18_9SACH|nr:unnamed protein product [Kluyveromyces dobzhanskii CBS 2104]